MESKKRKRRALQDLKNPLVYAFWSAVNKVCISLRFTDFKVKGSEKLPRSGPFLLVANHLTRWDGLIIYELLGRPSNFMVSPNELLGFQGAVLRSMGSFPADPRLDLLNHAVSLFKKGEAVVVFPEGNIFRDGRTHPFKTGAAKIAFAASQAGLELPVFPAAIHYKNEGRVAEVVIGDAVDASSFFSSEQAKSAESLRDFSKKLEREVSYLRNGLCELEDSLALFTGPPKWRWLAHLQSGEAKRNEKEEFASELLPLDFAAMKAARESARIQELEEKGLSARQAG